MSLSWLVILRAMEFADGNSGSASEGSKDIINGERAEEMGKLKEEVIKPNGPGVQSEKPKGFGLKKWRRRRRDLMKDAGGVHESHRILKRGLSAAGQLRAPNGAPSESKVKSEAIRSESSVGNSELPSASGFVHQDRMSDSGSWNAVNMFPAGGSCEYGEESSKSSTGASFPKSMPENIVREGLLNEVECKVVKGREEIKFPTMHECGFPAIIFDGSKPDSRGFGHRDERKSAGLSKKLRAEKTKENNAESEDPVHEPEDSGTSTGRVVHDFEGISGNHFEDGHVAGIGTQNKQEYVYDLGESSWSTGNNVGSSAVSDSSQSKAMAKRGSFASVDNGRWINEGLSLWSKNSDLENSTSERENSEEPRTFDSDERGSVNHDKLRESEEVRENSVFGCEDVVHSGESLASAVNVAEKKREETGGFVQQVDRMHQQPVDSDCLLQALTELRTAEEGLHEELQKIKDLATGVESSWMADSEHSSSSPKPTESKHGNENNMSDMPNCSHIEEKTELKCSSWKMELNKLNEKLKSLQEELEAANKRMLFEHMKVEELESQFQNQPIKLKEVERPPEATANELQLLQEKCREMELELEEQYKEKMQAEIEFLILTGSAQNDIALVENEASILQEQKRLVVGQLQTALKLKETEGRALSLKDHLVQLENSSAGLLEMEEVLELHNKVWGFSVFSFIQFILLCLAILFMFAQSPHASNLVPT